MRKPGFVTLILSIIACSSLLAQTSGTISGFARDPAGAFVPGVKLTIANERTGATRSVVSDETGFYQAIGLVSGVYTVEAEAPGFRRFRNTGVVLQVDENVRADVRLEIGDVQQTVEVTAMATQVDTRSSESSAVIDDRRIVDLPLGNRNVFALAKTLPGVLAVSASEIHYGFCTTVIKRHCVPFIQDRYSVLIKRQKPNQSMKICRFKNPIKLAVLVANQQILIPFYPKSVHIVCVH
jgi:hypothetical protein